jgi:transcriptional regulator of acetoin/glycerol metabolism
MDQRALIQASHERSLAFGLGERDRPDYSRVATSALQVALGHSQGLLSHAVPVMETLYQQIVNTHNMVVLTDSRGLILHSCGDADFLQRADQVALRPGIDWSERGKGTNAIGTALATGEASVVHGAEHFLRANHFLTCSCAPVRDPFGTVVGALDISGEHGTFHKHTLALVRMSAQMIENHFFSDTFPAATCVRFHSRPEFLGTLVEGIAAFSPDGAFLSANASAQFQLGLSLQAMRGRNFTSLFDASMGSLLDLHRRSGGGLASCCLHNGVAVYLRAEVSPARPAPRRPPAPIVPRAEPAPGPSHLHYLDTGDAQVARVISRVGKVLGKDIPVLVLGETGTGKELLARAIHGDSPRRGGPFVAINCASIPEGLIESELFGYTEGAFTGGRRKGNPGRIVAAHGGTLFLDEIGDMPAILQPRLLRALEERQVVPLGSDTGVPIDVSLVCATHRDPRTLIASGAFREDLYYRINGLVVRLPALRERTDLDAILQRLLHREGAGDVRIDPEAMALFRRCTWPGNVRQLANLLRTAIQMLDADRVLRTAHLPDDMEGQAMAGTIPVPAQAPAMGVAAAPAAADGSLQAREWAAIRETLERLGGNISATARALGVSRNTIYRRKAICSTRNSLPS